MKMTITENGIKKLIPENGMFLTDGVQLALKEVTFGDTTLSVLAAV